MKRIAFLAVLALAVGCTPKEQPWSISQALQSAVEAGAYLYGHQDDLSYGHNWTVESPESDDATRSDVLAVCGRYPAIVGYDLGGIELGEEANLDGVNFDFMRRSAVAHSERGGIVTFSWHLRNPLTGGDAWDVSSKEVVAAILEGGECHAMFMDWLSSVADFLLSLKDSDGNVVPVIFRPWHEHTGSWFWWGRDLCTEEEYNALWVMTWNYLAVERGIDALWAISPSSSRIEEWTARYPGDEYVDIIGVDNYFGRGADESKEDAYARFIESVHGCFDILAPAAAERGKLLALTETGCEGIPYDDWWTEALMPAIEGYPVSYVLTWRNAPASFNPKHFYAPFPGQESADDFVTFFESDKTVFLD